MDCPCALKIGTYARLPSPSCSWQRTSAVSRHSGWAQLSVTPAGHGEDQKVFIDVCTFLKLFCGVLSEFYICLSSLGSGNVLDMLWPAHAEYPCCNWSLKPVIGWPGLFSNWKWLESHVVCSNAIMGQKGEINRICLKVSNWDQNIKPFYVYTLRTLDCSINWLHT